MLLCCFIQARIVEIMPGIVGTCESFVREQISKTRAGEHAANAKVAKLHEYTVDVKQVTF